MEIKGFQEYQSQQNQSLNSMSQGELLLLLYDELVKRLVRAELALDKEEYPLFEASIDRSLDIIYYLDATLDRQYEVSTGLARLYEFLCYELRRVKAGRNKTELERVKSMAGELRDSFRTAQKETERQENASATGT